MLDRPPERRRERGAQEPERLQAHRRERIEHALRDVRREVHVKIVLVVRCRRRERVERGDVARLADPELPSPVDRPLDVLRTAEVVLNARPERREPADPPSIVSCWPAKLASGRSSAVADERTATSLAPSAR